MIETNQSEFNSMTDATWFKSIITCNNDVNLNINNSFVWDFNKKVSKKNANHRSDKAININSVNNIKV